ncbi:hypothetical protein CERZMDRAFT_115729 [Cercospora zeae-maydis SCOH1-5]|uniref:Heterokaryon incompatibility domain-containing protein n=1 Tax=Cercospora zeae-maydis SCOH1-5 TaxID=717836 RepID=A0A6A6F1N8_9PEZI|nr:hypothetical protein CERZMDRAFT_115729 [Cercospora zeae-maydis SCOH1-5]
MRLIDVETRELKFFVTCQEVEYAILSHTWGQEELTYQEFRNGEGNEKKCYAKIMQACNQAQRDGRKFVWVDTCCINKESSSEVSEAINSMWTYYIMSKLNRWFTRGWTLQELLAPRNVVFFDCAWRYLGSKRSLADCLSRVTGVDRATSHVEDRAYSLMGIFGIHMPLLYGEGERAFVRLQEEIIKTSTDISPVTGGGSAGYGWQRPTTCSAYQSSPAATE